MTSTNAKNTRKRDERLIRPAGRADGAARDHAPASADRPPQADDPSSPQFDDPTAPRIDDATASAAGKVSEAFEWVERARGALYAFHQLSGRADLILGEALEDMAAAGHERLAAEVRRELHGRNVLDGRWTFQIVEEYDELYYLPFVATEEKVRGELTAGRRHVHEARMKARERAGAGRDLWGPGA